MEIVDESTSFHYAIDTFRLASKRIYFSKIPLSIDSVLAYKSHLNLSFFHSVILQKTRVFICISLNLNGILQLYSRYKGHC